MSGRRLVMSDALSSIFTEEILGRLRKYAATSTLAAFRLRVIAPPAGLNQPGQTEYDHDFYAETRERWNRWIHLAISAGMFKEPYGAELKSRLTGIDHDGFRSALAECMTCWALSSELGLQVRPRPSGQAGRVLEFAVQTNQGDISFEVKSPRLGMSSYLAAESARLHTPLNTYSAAVAMRAALRSANRQFVRARRNILVIASPEINEPGVTTAERLPASLLRAFYGEQRAITTASGPPANQFVPEGNFLKRPGGVPRFTRISAVVGLEQASGRPEVRGAVLHNPCSEKPVDFSLFGQWTQFGAIGGEIRCIRAASPSVT